MKLAYELEEHPRGVDDVVGVKLVRRDHRVDAEALDAGVAHRGVAVEELVAGEAVLRLLGLADDGVAALERTGVVAAAEEARRERIRAIRNRGWNAADLTQGVEEERPVGDVVEVDDRAEIPRLHELLRRRVVGSEHNRLAGVADTLGEHQLGHRGAVAAEVELLQELHDLGIRRRLDRKVLAEPLVPRKRLLQPASVLADRLRVVDVERGRVFRGYLLKLRLVER